MTYPGGGFIRVRQEAFGTTGYEGVYVLGPNDELIPWGPGFERPVYREIWEFVPHNPGPGSEGSRRWAFAWARSTDFGNAFKNVGEKVKSGKIAVSPRHVGQTSALLKNIGTFGNVYGIGTSIGEGIDAIRRGEGREAFVELGSLMGGIAGGIAGGRLTQNRLATGTVAIGGLSIWGGAWVGGLTFGAMWDIGGSIYYGVRGY